MKAKYGLVILLVAVVALVAGGGEAAAGAGGKDVTGGGWINDSSGNKITFGFQGQYAGDGFGWRDAEGELQLVDHGSKTKIRGTFSDAFPFGIWVKFEGTCSINGTDDPDFTLEVWDYGEPGIDTDYIWIRIDTPEGAKTYWGYLGGGNIQVHQSTGE